MPINFNEAALILLDLKNKGNQCRPSRHSRKEVMTWAEIGAILVNHSRNQVLDKDSARAPRVCVIF